MELTQSLLIFTHLTSFVLGAFTMHIIHKKKNGHEVKLFRSLLALIVIFFWSASLYKEIFLGGPQTPYILYALFGLVQGAFFEFSIKDVITAMKNK